MSETEEDRIEREKREAVEAAVLDFKTQLEFDMLIAELIVLKNKAAEEESLAERNRLKVEGKSKRDALMSNINAISAGFDRTKHRAKFAIKDEVDEKVPAGSLEPEIVDPEEFQEEHQTEELPGDCLVASQGMSVDSEHWIREDQPSHIVIKLGNSKTCLDRKNLTANRIRTALVRKCKDVDRFPSLPYTLTDNIYVNLRKATGIVSDAIIPLYLFLGHIVVGNRKNYTLIEPESKLYIVNYALTLPQDKREFAEKMSDASFKIDFIKTKAAEEGSNEDVQEAAEKVESLLSDNTKEAIGSISMVSAAHCEVNDTARLFHIESIGEGDNEDAIKRGKDLLKTEEWKDLFDYDYDQKELDQLTTLFNTLFASEPPSTGHIVMEASEEEEFITCTLKTHIAGDWLSDDPNEESRKQMKNMVISLYGNEWWQNNINSNHESEDVSRFTSEEFITEIENMRPTSARETRIQRTVLQNPRMIESIMNHRLDELEEEVADTIPAEVNDDNREGVMNGMVIAMHEYLENMCYESPLVPRALDFGASPGTPTYDLAMQPDVSDSEDEDRFGVFDRRYDSSPTAEDFQEIADLLGEDSHRLSEADCVPHQCGRYKCGFCETEEIFNNSEEAEAAGWDQDIELVASFSPGIYEGNWYCPDHNVSNNLESPPDWLQERMEEVEEISGIRSAYGGKRKKKRKTRKKKHNKKKVKRKTRRVQFALKKNEYYIITPNNKLKSNKKRHTRKKKGKKK